MVEATSGLRLYGKRRSPEPEDRPQDDSDMEATLMRHDVPFMPAKEASKRRLIAREEQKPDGEQQPEKLTVAREQLNSKDDPASNHLLLQAGRRSDSHDPLACMTHSPADGAVLIRVKISIGNDVQSFGRR
jgi:hypothetical protein